ncbi:E3 ubiquitin-protein ligase E3D [Anabrus simplex]|uniref:E3 ubiquitin-protein ligase E3D n=1 Tax=Anabrus simplex TaxID=316456 RepID=UPI0035A36EC3
MQAIIVEVRPRLQTLYVFLKKKEDFYQKRMVNIEVKTSEISITWESDSGSEVHKLNVPCYKLVPNSISSLQIQEQSVVFRLQTEPGSNLVGSFSVEYLSYPKAENPLSCRVLTPPPIDNKPCEMKCRSCGYMLLNTAFDRILPLPSQCWEAGEWFCHKYSKNEEFTNIQDHLKATDCLYGSCFMYLHESQLNVSVGEIVRCCNCNSWLGTHSGSLCKIWNCTTTLGMTSQCSPLEDFLNIIKEAVHASPLPVCKIVIETKCSVSETNYLILWVLGKNLNMLVYLDDGDQELATSFSRSQESVIERTLHLKNTVKLLYAPHTKHSEIVKSWLSDVQVQTVDVAEQMFNDGLAYLTKVNHYIPPPHNKTNDFFVSYLELF